MGEVLALEQRRIERALAQRVRYRYVKARVLQEGEAFLVRAPNCSRNVAADGGEIDIALLEPVSGGWLLFSRDHHRLEWRMHTRGTLAQVLRVLTLDPSREFWL